MVNSSDRKWMEKEDGNAMIIGAFGIILILMLMGLMVDMGLYFVEHKKLGAAAAYADEEIQQMLPYYSFAADYREAFETEFYVNLRDSGYTAANVVQSSINRRNLTNLGHPVITMEIQISLADTYHCIILPVIGISELPVRANRSIIKNYSVEKFYNPGMPFSEWKGGIEWDGD